MEKKKWEKPKLIVLLRGKPEEAVLQGCKVFSNLNELQGAHFMAGGCSLKVGGACMYRCAADGS